MPPLSLFKKRDRPSGMEFPCCKACNNGTSAADAAVAFVARIDMNNNDINGWKIQEGVKNLSSSDHLIPGLKQEIFGDESSRLSWIQTEGGILKSVVEMRTGPILQALLKTFTAKLAMALYKEHIGEPLPLDGSIFGRWFLNAGLSQEDAESMLEILPTHNTLKQGRCKGASGQFDYRYNSDNKSIVAALTHFHSNIHFFTIAMADPIAYGFPERSEIPLSIYAKPGALLSIMPERPPAILMPNFTEPSKPFKLFTKGS